MKHQFHVVAILFSLLYFLHAIKGDPYAAPENLESYANYHCYKQSKCTPGGDRVCGYDEYISFVAIFEDKCTFHKANCLKSGIYHIVDFKVCEMKLQFNAEHNESYEFEFSHVYTDRTTETVKNKTVEFINSNGTTTTDKPDMNAAQSKRGKIVYNLMQLVRGDE